jgi:hypothetical protein
MKGKKYLEYMSDRYVLVSISYLGGVHIKKQTILVLRDIGKEALWTFTAIFCRIQLSLPWTCRNRSLQEKSYFNITLLYKK